MAMPPARASGQTKQSSKQRQRAATSRKVVVPVSSRSQPVTNSPPVSRSPLLLAFSAGLCWVGALLLLFLVDLRAEPDPLAPQRLLFYVLVMTAGLLTFVPLEQRMGLSGITLQGVGGTALLLYILAFVPPPSQWLLSLPDLPVYGLIIVALFWSTSAIVLPFIYAASQQLFQQRARRLDLRRARRQAHEAGLLLACIAVLAGLGVFHWISLLLVVLIIFIAELLFLSRVKAEGTERS
ncbi:MAG: hypothetical protein HC837_02935 [Chloroflexaceae bacterium]|nr:hypothetical protein [Chloroflexaceae bacterium]